MTAPARKRISREESREMTRQRLLEAAARVIPRKGYQGASVEDIAAEAGFTRGAFYSNFGSKDELFIALLRRVSDQKHAEVDAIFAEGGSAEVMRAKLRDFYARLCQEQLKFVLWTEAKVHAARDAEFRRRLVELERQTRERITCFVERYCKEAGRHDTGKTHAEIAIGLMALTDGMAFAQMMDPEVVSEDVAQSVLTKFFEAVVRDGV